MVENFEPEEETAAPLQAILTLYEASVKDPGVIMHIDDIANSIAPVEMSKLCSPSQFLHKPQDVES